MQYADDNLLASHTALKREKYMVTAHRDTQRQDASGRVSNIVNRQKRNELTRRISKSRTVSLVPYGVISTRFIL